MWTSPRLVAAAAATATALLGGAQAQPVPAGNYSLNLLPTYSIAWDQARERRPVDCRDAVWQFLGYFSRE